MHPDGALTAQHLAAIVESSDDAIVSKDLNGIVQSWNRAAEQMFGYTAAEMVGRSIRTIIPADRQSEEDEVLARLRRGERIDHFETVRRAKDGTLIDISLTVSPVRDDSGTIVGASKIARDIRERKRVEDLSERARRQAVLLAHVSAGLAESGSIDRMAATVAELLAPTVADYCAIDLCGEDGQLTRAATSGGTAQVMLSGFLRLPADDPNAPLSPFEVTRSAVPVHSQSAALEAFGLSAYVCVPIRAHNRTFGALTLANAMNRAAFTEQERHLASDIAARTALAIENATTYRQLEQANRLKDEFLATLSHELRTPLNAVLGYSRMLRSGTVASERIPRALEVIERNASSLTQIVEDVLDISRIVSGKVRLRLQPVDLQQVVGDAAATVAHAADAKGVRLHVLADSSLGPVAGDPERLQQVVWNLLSNAVKFTPRGGRVQARVEPVNSHVEIIVSDTGIGVSKDFLPHMFERFRQAEGGTNRRHGGLGLGLAIARHIVEMHGGTIHAASEGEGKGATFRVKLPLMIVHREYHPEPVREHPHVHSAAPLELVDLSGLTVLAVDDDKDALELVAEILQSAGARPIVAHSAEHALQVLGETIPDVLIADVGMPEVDGFELIRRIRQAPDPALSRIPAAALTAYARSEDRVKALRSGFELHLTKPVNPAELVAAVSALARRNALRSTKS